MTAELVCPKCHGAMRSYERNAVTIDQCVDCRGIFLDRGELERLLDAEAAYNTAAYTTGGPGQPVSPAPPAAYPYQDTRQGGHHGQQRGSGGHHSQRRKGFLGELFD